MQETVQQEPCDSRLQQKTLAQDKPLQPVPTQRVPGWTGGGRPSRATTEIAALARGPQFHARLAHLTPCCFPLCLRHSHAKVRFSHGPLVTSEETIRHEGAGVMT